MSNQIKGYAYAHVSTPTDIIVQNNWQGSMSSFKTPTVIKYKDETYTTVDSWGYPAWVEKPRRKPSSTPSKPIVELFKLHLLGESLEEKDRPFLPDGLDFRNVIRDYLKKLCESLKESLETTWLNLDFYKKVLIVLTVRDQNLPMISSLKKKSFNFFLLSRFRQNLTITRSIHYAIAPLMQV